MQNYQRTNVLFRYMDFVNVMTYDFHGAWDSFTGHNSPLYQGASDNGEHVYFNTVSKTYSVSKQEYTLPFT